MENINYSKFEDKEYRSKMQVVVDKEKPTKRKVFYDYNEDAYIKVIYIKKIKKILCFFGLRNYPGINFKKVSDILIDRGIKTPEIIYASKYVVVTKNIKGVHMSKALLELEESNIEEVINQYAKIIALIIREGIFFPDLHFDNFIVREEFVYPIDLDAYKMGIFYLFKRRKFISLIKEYKLKKYFKNQLDFAKENLSDVQFEKLKKILNHNKVWGKIEELL